MIAFCTYLYRLVCKENEVILKKYLDYPSKIVLFFGSMTLYMCMYMQIDQTENNLGASK